MITASERRPPLEGIHPAALCAPPHIKKRCCTLLKFPCKGDWIFDVASEKLPKSAKMEGQNPAQVGFSKSQPFFVRVDDFSTGNDFMRICCARHLVRTQISMRTEGRKVHLLLFFLFGAAIFAPWGAEKFSQDGGW